MYLRYVWIVGILIGTAIAQPVTFGTAISQGYFVPNEEYDLWSYDGQGVITYFWCTEANDPVGLGDTVFNFYVDGETDPSISFTLDMLAGIGFDDNQAPWGNGHFGKGAKTGAIYSTIRIPFQKSISITGQLPPSATQGITFWWIIRGVENIPITIGGYQLPSTAKLTLYQNNNVTLQPLEYLDLVNSDNNGAVWMVVLSVTSGNLNYLEGCVRMYTQGATEPALLSSGTEDYFQSAFYFDGGQFWFPEAGFTHYNGTSGQLSAYKVHNLDALFFTKGGFKMTWRNGEYMDPSTGQKCVDQGNVVGNPQRSVVTTYTWVYEW